MTCVRLLRRVLNPLVCTPQGETGGCPEEVRPSPPPCGWSIGFIATPRTVGRMPRQRLRPALPIDSRLCSALPTSPMVTRPWLLRPLVLDCLEVSATNGPPLYSSGVTTLTSARRPGEVGFTLSNGMAARFLFGRREVDFLPGGEPHVGLFPVAAPAFDAPEAALLALHVGHGHGVDLGLEHELDRGLDLGLGGAVGHAEHVLAV